MAVEEIDGPTLELLQILDFFFSFRERKQEDEAPSDSQSHMSEFLISRGDFYLHQGRQAHFNGTYQRRRNV